jgi:hypothetical protein
MAQHKISKRRRKVQFYELSIRLHDISRETRLVKTILKLLSTSFPCIIKNLNSNPINYLECVKTAFKERSRLESYRKEMTIES